MIDQFDDADRRWIPAESEASSLTTIPKPLAKSLVGCVLYNNRGFRLRIIDGFSPAPKKGQMVVIVLEAATEYDPGSGTWNGWTEERRTTVRTVEMLFATVADWATEIGENDRTSPAGMHALLDWFSE